MDVLSLTVDLIDKRKVEVKAFDPFSVEHSHLGLVLLILHVFDHIWEPHSQSMVTDSDKHMGKLNKMSCITKCYFFFLNLLRLILQIY